MICYFDTSAFVPLLVEEPSSANCDQLWRDADAIVTSQLLYVETASALAQKRRNDSIDRRQHHTALRRLDRYFIEFDVVDIDELLVQRAAELAELHALRSYDAVHCAAAEHSREADLLVASGDKQLLTACVDLGLSTADINEAL